MPTKLVSMYGSVTEHQETFNKYVSQIEFSLNKENSVNTKLMHRKPNTDKYKIKFQALKDKETTRLHTKFWLDECIIQNRELHSAELHLEKSISKIRSVLPPFKK